MDSYNLQWLIENQVIVIDLNGAINMTIATSLSSQLTTLLDDTPNPIIHVIVNDNQAVSLPKISEMNTLQSSLKHPKVGWIISVGANINPVVKFVSSIAIQLAGVKFKRVNSFEEAIETLKQIDLKIEWIAD